MWPFQKTQFWVIAAAANASLWTQLCIKQTPTYPRQRTVSPLTAARTLQNRFTFCCPALLWTGKRALKPLRAFSGKMWLWWTISFLASQGRACFSCVFLGFFLLEKEKKHKGHESMISQVNKTLTLVLALAELLTEILGHHTRAGAVARMVRVITWLVVVHLIGRVIWSNRGQKPSDWHSKLHCISEGIV